MGTLLRGSGDSYTIDMHCNARSQSLAIDPGNKCRKALVANRNVFESSETCISANH